ncbi:MAG: hypothetical protein JWM93_727 [Frankiales bacterium]|nr:hypothetical protein [Frankiales bacterium]
MSTQTVDLDFDPNGLLSAAEQFAGGVLLAAMNGGINYWATVTGCDFDGPSADIHIRGVDRHDGHKPFLVTLARIQHAMDTLVDQPSWLDLRRFSDVDRRNLPASLRLFRSQFAAGVPLARTAAADDIDPHHADLLVQLAVHEAVLYA